MNGRDAHFNFHLEGSGEGWAWRVFDAEGVEIGAGHDRDRRVAAARIIQALITQETGGEPVAKAQLRAA